MLIHLRLAKKILQLISGHFKLLLAYLNPIKRTDSLQCSHRSVRRNSLFAIAIILYTTLYGTFGLHFDSTGEMLARAKWSQSPYVCTHQAMPRSAWNPTDFGTFADLLYSLASLAALFYIKPIQNQFILFNCVEWQRITVGTNGNYSGGEGKSVGQCVMSLM